MTTTGLQILIKIWWSTLVQDIIIKSISDKWCAKCQSTGLTTASWSNDHSHRTHTIPTRRHWHQLFSRGFRFCFKYCNSPRYGFQEKITVSVALSWLLRLCIVVSMIYFRPLHTVWASRRVKCLDKCSVHVSWSSSPQAATLTAIFCSACLPMTDGCVDPRILSPYLV